MTGLIGKIIYAVLVGVVTFVVIWIIGAIVVHFENAIGTKVEQFAPLIGLLAGLVQFFAGSVPNWPTRAA